jgi:2,3-dihydroxyphenylpropionate 1,2-dioxygenase
MIVGTVCLSHSPLMERRRANPEMESKFGEAIKAANKFTAETNPDLTVLFYPDHLNGFFYDFLPCFCIGVQGEAIGDFGTVPGRLDIPESVAMDCAETTIQAGIDVGISYKMKVDHGATQPVELLSASTTLNRLLPIFINCVAAPRPSFSRARALGDAVGKWAQSRPERILIIGSGGLSHDPPLPNLSTATPEVKAHLTNGAALSYAERVARQARTLSLADYTKPDTPLRPLNPEWDRQILGALSTGKLDVLDNIDDHDLTKIGGSGAHEIRCWIAALSAAKAAGTLNSKVLFYEPIEPWITGMGVMTTSTQAFS